ncbi:MAG: hypothetical protein B7Z66_14420 [Chromatiales bacterium 21-64-14]|nr:MAG: hypothetical protein B7Z66_14420 [Chromatiales bacterium 21-64-14]
MRTILVVCPSHRDYREIAALGVERRHRVLFHEYASIELEQMVAPAPMLTPVRDALEEIDGIVERFSAGGPDGVVSTDDYPGSTLAGIVAERFGLPGVPAMVNLRCQHKYHSRLLQQAVVPHAVPEFALAAGDEVAGLEFPVFVKPIKSFFSVGAYRVEDAQAFSKALARATLPEPFFDPLRRLFERYAGCGFGPSRVLVEELLEGVQVTVEGYAFSGTVQVFGIVDSVLFPGTLAFRRFEYPSSLPSAVQDRMAGIAAQVMTGIRFDNGLFNIEMMYDPTRERIHIIEINPRMASQFADLYEKVDGFNTYELLIDLALGKEPSLRRGQGPHRRAASCVLRTFEDRRVVRVPSEEDVAGVMERYSDARVEILTAPGRCLSEEMQDSESYRYGLVSLGGGDLDDILGALEECERRLGFVLEPVEASGAERVAGVSGRRTV